MNSNSVEEKWDEYWWIRYWKFAHEYDVRKKKKTLKGHISLHGYVLDNGLNGFQFGTVEATTYES